MDTDHFVAWHKQKPFVAELLAKADELLEIHKPRADFVSIGQSPTWLCRTAHLTDRARMGSSRFCYVPFSRSFCERGASFIEDGKIVAEFKVKRPPLVHNYRKRLKKRHLSPQQIIESHRRDKRPTVFIDYINSGKGLASFMHMMYDWARESGPDTLRDFLAATRVHTLKEEDKRGIEIMRFPDLGLSIEPTSQRISDNFSHYFADSRDDSPDRLVGFYPPTEWHRGSPDVRNVGLLADIGNVIGSAVMMKEGRSSHPLPKRPDAQKFAGFTSPQPALPIL